jgi:hypothetical protein
VQDVIISSKPIFTCWVPEQLRTLSSVEASLGISHAKFHQLSLSSVWFIKFAPLRLPTFFFESALHCNDSVFQFLRFFTHVVLQLPCIWLTCFTVVVLSLIAFLDSLIFEPNMSLSPSSLKLTFFFIMETKTADMLLAVFTSLGFNTFNIFSHRYCIMLNNKVLIRGLAQFQTQLSMQSLILAQAT